VLALVRREGAADSDAAPPTAALTAAVQYAQTHGITIGAQAAWSDLPANDIITAAEDARVAWILLGYHRNAKGGTMGGVVREVFSKARPLAINVGVFIQGTDRPIERVFAAIDTSTDGRAALALAIRIAQHKQCKLRALLVSKRMTPHPDPELVNMARDARTEMGSSLFHSDVLTEHSLHQLFRQSPGRLLIVGKKFADEVGLPLDEVPGGDRCVIVVQGAEAPEEPEDQERS
jgi:hypothetical protein